MTIHNKIQGSIHQTDPHSQLSGYPFSSIWFIISSSFNAKAIFRIFLSSFMAAIPSTRSAMTSCMKSSLWYSKLIGISKSRTIPRSQLSNSDFGNLLPFRSSYRFAKYRRIESAMPSWVVMPLSNSSVFPDQSYAKHALANIVYSFIRNSQISFTILIATPWTSNSRPKNRSFSLHCLFSAHR